MASTWLIAFFALVLAYALVRRGAQEASPILAVGLTPLTAAGFVVGVGNYFSRDHLWQGALLLAVLAALAQALGKAPAWEKPEWSRWGKIAFWVGAVATLFYVLAAQQLELDTDNWIHEPLIALYIKGVFPPVHPFFPEISMNGHYGRDLLIATLTPSTVDPLATVWILNPLLLLSTYFTLFGTLRRFGHGDWASLLGTWMAFGGICVGFRVGLVDTFDGNNGVVYALAVGLFYWMFRVLALDDKATHWSVWVTAGLQLGLYQLVYETHFGLLLMSAFCLVLWKARSRRVWAAVAVTLVLALGLAFTEGGPFTDLAHSHQRGRLTAVQQNVSQHVSMKFPKKELFKALVTKADYQRLSVAYKTGPFQRFAPGISGEGYMSIFDPRFWWAHWLPLYLAPLVGFFLWRRRDASALSFWLFGLWAYLIPGLVDFGPVYEWEYFRWEYAAGFGFAVALGVAMGSAWESVGVPEGCRLDKTGLQLRWSKGLAKAVVLALLLLATLLPAEKQVNSAIVRLQKLKRIHWTPSSWRVAYPDLGITEADLQAMRYLREHTQAGDKVMTNLGSETPFGLWPDSILGALTGAYPAGRAKPPTDERQHAYPNFNRAPEAKLFYQTGDPNLLYPEGIRWLLLDIDRFQHAQELAKSPQVKAGPVFEDDQGNRRQVFELNFDGYQMWVADGTLKADVENEFDAEELRAGELYKLRLTLSNNQAAPSKPGWMQCALTDKDGHLTTRLSFLMGREPLAPGAKLSKEVAFATPLEDGDYTLQIGSPNQDPLISQPVRVDFRERLQALSGHFEMPERVEPSKVVAVELRLTSERAIESHGELSLKIRYLRDSGEPVWELDNLSQPLNLSLKPGQSASIPVELFTPWHTGAYQIVPTILDKTSGRQLTIQVEPGVLRVTEAL